MKQLQVKIPTRENFKQFGTVVTSCERESSGGDTLYAWYEKLTTFEGTSNISVNILKCKARSFQTAKMEQHHQTKELLTALDGSVVITAAPAGTLDESKLEAFYLERGSTVVFDEDVWHFIPLPVASHDVDCMVVFRHGTGADDLLVEELKEPVSYQL